jgi:hypothetical protein
MLLKQQYCSIKEKVQWFIVKMTHWFNFIPAEILYKQKLYGERKLSLWSNSEDLNTDRVQGRT